MTALSHAVVCRRRYLYNNQISTIANGAFTGLTALTELYGAGLWGFWLSLAVAAWWLHGCGGLSRRAYLRPAFFYNGMACSPRCYHLNKLLFISAHDCMPSTHRFILSCFFVYEYVCVCMYVYASGFWCVCVCVLVCVRVP